MIDTGTWVDQALCRGKTSLFFSQHPSDVSLAKAICERCPVVEECAVESRGMQYGVWAGKAHHWVKTPPEDVGTIRPCAECAKPFLVTRRNKVCCSNACASRLGQRRRRNRGVA